MTETDLGLTQAENMGSAPGFGRIFKGKESDDEG